MCVCIVLCLLYPNEVPPELSVRLCVCVCDFKKIYNMMPIEERVAKLTAAQAHKNTIW